MIFEKLYVGLIFVDNLKVMIVDGLLIQQFIQKTETLDYIYHQNLAGIRHSLEFLKEI